jgi:hypothetical protein
VRFSQCGKPTQRLLGPVHPAGGDLFQSPADFFIQRVAFFFRPALFRVQGLQSAADHVLGIREGAGRQPLLHQGFKIGGGR